ncbi:hypothetical protein MHD_03105 [Mannheimia granulomatis]|uniref:Uncharacterized protein n=1 Tax=Mannheimia granulomatis TaxID=85402 RepID=A0A011NFG5_9PAST|nr:hypothetical protein AK33_01680 [Mannheimia granulomatis]RGE48955.1 hypothetical protein MHD_03105 [Mannheimia granulomatis]
MQQAVRFTHKIANNFVRSLEPLAKPMFKMLTFCGKKFAISGSNR